MFKIHICRYLNGHETFTMSSIFPRVAYVSLVLHFCMAASSGVAAVTVSQGIRSRTVGEYVAIMKAMRESISVCPGYATAYFDFPAQDKYDFVDAILSSDTNCFVELRKRLLNVTSSQIPESAVLAFIRLGLVDKFNERFKGGMVPKIKDERIETGVSNLVYTSIFAMSQAMSENVSNGELGFSALLIDANKCRIVASSFDGRLLLAWHRQSSDCYLVGVDFVCYRNFLHSPVKLYFYVPGYDSPLRLKTYPRRIAIALWIFRIRFSNLQFRSPTQTLVNVASVEMLPMPIPIPNWKLATLELDIFTLATFTNSNSKTQTPNENVPQ